MTQKRTYLPYEGGIDPKRLRIGSLYLDKFNPTIGLEAKRFEFHEDHEESEYWENILKWTKDPQETEPCSFGFEVGRDSSFGASVAKSLKIDWEKQHNVHLTLTGDSGRRFEVQKPMKFFEQEVYSQSEIKNWIQKQYSINFLTKVSNALRHKPWKAPEVWMLTGIQLIKGGHVEEGASMNNSVSGSTTLDPGVAHGVQTGVDISIHGGHAHTESVNATYYHRDERVWAAQFMQLDVEFKKVDPPVPPVNHSNLPQTEMGKTRMCVTLKDVVHLGDNALRKAKDEDDDSDTGSEPVEFEAHIVGLKGPDAVSPELAEKTKSSVTPKAADEASNQEIAEVEFAGIEFSLEKYLEAAQGIDWEEYEKYSKYWDDLEKWERSEAEA